MKVNAIPELTKSVRLGLGIVFTFIPESRSASPRNRVHRDPGTAFTLARNKHDGIEPGAMTRLEVNIKFPMTTHEVSIEQLEKYIASTPKSPATPCSNRG
jgi:hypothetical protein